ncbi:exodeoxyribonuclease VII large subunit [Thalassotalea euphylliae]|uniref:Exodeoxyribonuclease 7 large subunit n=1 Tax=Thalassotalea euphylliae TaxID=1655234 RepID=A0A3E0TMS2_9GAMM|nr:exodeoxyribonuclease VII large subunit [Thalassotalea euphylliae]REL25836.1 exodeoxyribonuclease VII large subunit [Thalassotalea euphylliae]
MTNKQHILQVSELTRKVRFMLESEINVVWLSGEISNFIAAGSGHWYLSLKDSRSQVKCAMFKGNNRYVRLTPKNGQQVLVKAKVSLYEPRGDFQLIIEQMEDAGEGLLRQQYEALKAKLYGEGLFAASNKQPILTHYNKVGVVTSPTGAAIKDIISVMARRSPTTELVIYPALVQGELAASDIVASIDIANQRQEVDVLIVGRGGGSLEDLWCFNDERVVRAISESRLPVISAVGHEIDTTLADFAADVRAPTPSAAAELISGDQQEQLANIAQLTQRCQRAIAQKLDIAGQRSTYLAQRIQQCDPQRQLQVVSQQADELEQRLTKAMRQLLANKGQQPTLLAQRLHHQSPARAIDQYQQQVAQLEQRMKHSFHQALEKQQQRFAALAEQLHLVSPLATIARGYSIARDNDGKIVKSVAAVELGDVISVQVNDGRLDATVQKKTQQKSPK